MKTKTYIVLTIGTLAFSFVAIYFLMTELLLLPRGGAILILIPTSVIIIPIVVSAMIQGQRNCIDAKQRNRMPMPLVEDLTKLTFISICTATLSMLALGSLIYGTNKYIGLIWCVITAASALYLYKKTLHFKEHIKPTKMPNKAL